MSNVRIVSIAKEELEKMGYELRDGKVYPKGYWLNLGGDFNGTAMEAYDIVSKYCTDSLYTQLVKLTKMNQALVSGKLSELEKQMYFKQERVFFRFFDMTIDLGFKFTNTKDIDKYVGTRSNDEIKTCEKNDKLCEKSNTDKINEPTQNKVEKPKVRKIKITGCVRNDSGLTVGYEYLHNGNYGKLWAEELDAGLKDGTIELERVVK